MVMHKNMVKNEFLFSFPSDAENFQKKSFGEAEEYYPFLLTKIRWPLSIEESGSEKKKLVFLPAWLGRGTWDGTAVPLPPPLHHSKCGGVEEGGGRRGTAVLCVPRPPPQSCRQKKRIFFFSQPPQVYSTGPRFVLPRSPWRHDWIHALLLVLQKTSVCGAKKCRV